jgi:triphosphoribosyl-dephospho-CoA synthase
MLAGDAVAAAYRDVCLAELAALKPGNVHVFAGGHDMTTADFEASAEVSAAAMGAPALSVGERIFEAIRRTRETVGCNTNLGIVLLCAPLAQAALSPAGGSLRERLRDVLRRLDVADAERAFAAIRLAEPGGLGAAPQHDVRAPPTVSLAVAMAAAADRDCIAAQYTSGFADIFELGLPRLRAGLSRWRSEQWATTSAYLAFLARLPDSHVARKYGMERAQAVCAMARPFEAQLRDVDDPGQLAAPLLAFDRELKAAGINPGTSADLTVAALFAHRIETGERLIK